jgi:hypothetical protein
MKAWDIVAWTYDADMHCPTCAERRFGAAKLADDELPPIDSEGNEIQPVFSSDEPGDCGDYCGDCLELIREAYGAD